MLCFILITFYIATERYLKQKDIGFNRPTFTDRTPDELEEIHRATGCSESYPVYISQSHLQWWVKNYNTSGEHCRRCFEEWHAMYG
jgi:hypothetical protein